MSFSFTQAQIDELIQLRTEKKYDIAYDKIFEFLTDPATGITVTVY